MYLRFNWAWHKDYIAAKNTLLLYDIQDTIAVSKNMSYDFKGTGEIPNLQDFKIRLAKHLLRSSFYQDEEKETFDMLR